MEAGLSPSYEIAEDDQALIRETFEVLLQAVQSGTLRVELESTDVADRADEATQSVLDALDTGLRAESRETEWYVYYGLDALVEGFIRFRDIPPPDSSPAVFDVSSFQSAADGILVRLAKAVKNGSPGSDWIVRTASVLSQAAWPSMTRYKYFAKPGSNSNARRGIR